MKNDKLEIKLIYITKFDAKQANETVFAPRLMN